jgi:hypothetical protein
MEIQLRKLRMLWMYIFLNMHPCGPVHLKLSKDPWLTTIGYEALGNSFYIVLHQKTNQSYDISIKLFLNNDLQGIVIYNDKVQL